MKEFIWQVSAFSLIIACALCFTLVTTITKQVPRYTRHRDIFLGKYRGRNFEYRPSLHLGRPDESSALSGSSGIDKVDIADQTIPQGCQEARVGKNHDFFKIKNQIFYLNQISWLFQKKTYFRDFQFILCCRASIYSPDCGKSLKHCQLHVAQN